MGWTMLYLFVFLKLPIVGACWIVWWAVHQETDGVEDGGDGGGGGARRRPPPPPPPGGAPRPPPPAAEAPAAAPARPARRGPGALPAAHPLGHGGRTRALARALALAR